MSLAELVPVSSAWALSQASGSSRGTSLWRVAGSRVSTSGCTDENGAIADIYAYTDYGHTVRYKPVLDCPDSIVSSVANDTPSAGQTTITLSGLLLTADAYNGLELRVVRPEAASNRLLYGEVLDTTSSTIVVQDDGSDSIYSALNSATQGFQVLDLPAAEASPSSTSGTWDLGAGYDPIAGTTSYTDFSAFSAAYIGMQLFPETDTYPNVSFTIIDVPNSSTVVVEGDTSAYGASAGDPYTIAERCWRYDSVNDESDYFDADASFAAFMVGWTFVPDISKPCYLPVIAVDAENGSITVKGDASGLAAPLTDRYHLIPPAGVARSTGALAKPEDAGDSTWNGAGSYDDPGAKWLWSGYLYVTPQVGHGVSGTTYGAQSGTNHLGQYHCNNRVYDINQGRWTSNDQSETPCFNLLEYIASNPVAATDPSGLAQFIFDPFNCMAFLSIKINLEFKSLRGSWTSATEKNTWAADMKQRIESRWSGKWRIKCADSYDAKEYYWRPTLLRTSCGVVEGRELMARKVRVPCPCPQGWLAVVNVRWAWGTKSFKDADIVASVRKIGAPPDFEQSSVTLGAKTAELDSNDTVPRTDITQTPCEHEFGHMIGLHHPCRNQRWNPNCYDAHGNFSEYNDPDKPAGTVGGVPLPFGAPSSDILGAGSDVGSQNMTPWIKALEEAFPKCQPCKAVKP